ncbi:hypothetical protein EV363DRAFT_1168362 [Boletus edulis]|uniref:Uncharacterized protein n=1 Tax=Boletus edulis BED1 TaxID=1328754 RepID=A0AAD4GC11_BOLED|nr:hypothetical protein EV363DRAFT_1168362 [Boletus edulis]KAF8435484.1 hypothetical protein L210DRAFT_981480 [Boletus edulis BED1]
MPHADTRAQLSFNLQARELLEWIQPQRVLFHRVLLILALVTTAEPPPPHQAVDFVLADPDQYSNPPGKTARELPECRYRWRALPLALLSFLSPGIDPQPPDKSAHELPHHSTRSSLLVSSPPSPTITGPSFTRPILLLAEPDHARILQARRHASCPNIIPRAVIVPPTIGPHQETPLHAV